MGRDLLAGAHPIHVATLVERSSRFMMRWCASKPRNISSVTPDNIWIADIIYVRFREGFIHLSFILDDFAAVESWADRWPHIYELS